MFIDSIVEEVRKIREKLAEECGFDAHKISEKLKINTELSKKNGLKIVSKKDMESKRIKSA